MYSEMPLNLVGDLIDIYGILRLVRQNPAHRNGF